MSRDSRLDALENRLGGGDGRVTFELVTPPAGLTAEQHDRWSAAQQREAEARGVCSFTLNLGATDVR